MRRTYLFLVLLVAGPVLGGVVWWSAAGRAQPGRAATTESSPGRSLPLTQVVLFNTGVGYFQRQGDVEGNARIDLSFPLTDVNDLLKSITVEDGERLAPISYDGAEPVERTLRSFALDLTGNPTFGQLLNQARGEKVEVNLESSAVGLPATMSGTIVGMEASFDNGTAETHHLNLLTADGMRRLPLARILRIRFLNAHLEEEFRRALGALAAGHNNQRRHVRLALTGAGKRTVKIGYVVESPIWKATYRLALDAKNVKSKLQAWAIIENTSDEDWKDIRLVLVSGRPITFRSDLSEPLFVPRPTVNAEVFASLRPPRHEGAVIAGGMVPGQPLNPLDNQRGGQLGVQIGGLNLGGFQIGGLAGAGLGGGAFGIGGGMIGMNTTFLAPGALFNRYQIDPGTTRPANRLSWEELAQRRDELLDQQRQARERAAQWGSAIADSIEAIAVDADRIGEEFSYNLDQKVNLGRQKSALLPVLHEGITAIRCSVYNKQAHPRFPLRALRVRNTTKHHLLQGPLTVLDGGRFVGDSKLPDLQPGEERLISYAMDLGVEVRDESSNCRDLRGVRIQSGKLHFHYRDTRSTTYTLRNRSREERLVLVEHPITANWILTEDSAATEKGHKLYRFAWKVPTSKAATHTVTEQLDTHTSNELRAQSNQVLEALRRERALSQAVRDALDKILERRRHLEKATTEVAQPEARLRALLADQERLKAFIDRAPRESLARKRYLEKYDEQEVQIEKQRGMVQEKAAVVSQLEAELARLIQTLDAR